MNATKDFLTPCMQASGKLPIPSTPLQWEFLIRQARHANLLGRLAFLLHASGQLDAAPAQARPHFQSARTWSIAQRRAVRWEAREIRKALANLTCPVVLLKGAAYVLSELPAAEGRLFSDVDILVPRESIGSVETFLMLAGWSGGKHDAHEQRYYRQWMHEIPPMTNSARGTVIDVHHNILPLTSRIKVDADKLLADVVPLEAWPGLFRLSDTDLVLHSACHLFLDGEFDKGLRDLVDLDALLRHFGKDASYWACLVARARVLGLALILFYAVRYTAGILHTPVPESSVAALASGGPGRVKLALMDAIFVRALRPDHPSCDDPWTAMARGFLYLRAHWMRMPARLLLPHLLTKAWRRFKDERKTDGAQVHAPH